MGCGQVKEECEEGVAGLPLGNRRWSLETPDSLENGKTGHISQHMPFQPIAAYAAVRCTCQRAAFF